MNSFKRLEMTREMIAVKMAGKVHFFLLGTHFTDRILPPGASPLVYLGDNSS